MDEKKEYIERGALIYRLEYYYSHTSGDIQYAYGVALRESQSAPAADVAPVVHREWIKNNNERSCPECGFTYYTIIDTFNYCPHCGVKMDGGKHEN